MEQEGRIEGFEEEKEAFRLDERQGADRGTQKVEALSRSTPSCSMRPFWPQPCPSPSQVI